MDMHYYLDVSKPQIQATLVTAQDRLQMIGLEMRSRCSSVTCSCRRVSQCFAGPAPQAEGNRSGLLSSSPFLGMSCRLRAGSVDWARRWPHVYRWGQPSGPVSVGLVLWYPSTGWRGSECRL